MDLHERHAQISDQLEQAKDQAQQWMNRANHLNAVKTELEVWLQEERAEAQASAPDITGGGQVEGQEQEPEDTLPEPTPLRPEMTS